MTPPRGSDGVPTPSAGRCSGSMRRRRTGPRLPSHVQDVMHFDQVCYDFPELRIVMRHGAPQEDVDRVVSVIGAASST